MRALWKTGGDTGEEEAGAGVGPVGTPPVNGEEKQFRGGVPTW
jgi:hypothetical protein